MRLPTLSLVSSALLLGTGVTACAKVDASDWGLGPQALHNVQPDAPAPGPTVALALGGGSTLTAFPYLADDLSDQGRDPVNLVFLGQSDPRQIRAALMALDGDRSGSPLAPFDCTWSDAIGGLQTAWTELSGWVGSAIQLECGDYGPVRFHLRFFQAGQATLGGAHFEFLIPGTSDHQVVSWELAEQLVAYDLFRSGLLGAAPASTGPVNAAPWFRTIPAVLHAAASADPGFAFLLSQLGLTDLPGGDKGIPTDGAATVLTLSGSAPLVAGTATQDFEVPFGQVIPKPFCVEGAPSPYLHVSGKVRLTLRSTQHAGGDFDQQMDARGRLTLTPWDPAGNRPVGPAYEASVTEFQNARIDRQGASIQGMQHQLELGSGAPGRGQLQIRIKVGARGLPVHDRAIRCGGG